MSGRPFRIVLGFVVLVALATASIAFAATRDHSKRKGDQGSDFTAHLNGYQETPSLNTTGMADISLTIGSNQITFDLTYSGLSGNPTVAHVHVAQVGVAGGISFFLCGGGSKPACPSSTSGEVKGTVVPSDIIGPTDQGFSAGDAVSVVKAIRAGVTYANVHTAKFPNGEIRGQLFPAHDDHWHGD